MIRNLRYFLRFRFSNTKDLYAVLNIPKTSTASEIKKQYLKLAKQYHPDYSPNTAEKFKEINAAYEILGDEKKVIFKKFREISMIAEDQEISNNLQVELMDMIHLEAQGFIIQIDGVLDHINMIMFNERPKCSENTLDNDQQHRKVFGNNTNSKYKKINITMNRKENVLFLQYKDYGLSLCLV